MIKQLQHLPEHLMLVRQEPMHVRQMQPTAAPFSASNAILGYTDNCTGALTATLTNTNVTGTDCGWTVTYTFTVKDVCGNELTGRTYSNTGSDQTPPSLTVCAIYGINRY
jgi:hypothetical protein